MVKTELGSRIQPCCIAAVMTRALLHPFILSVPQGPISKSKSCLQLWQLTEQQRMEEFQSSIIVMGPALVIL